MLQRMHPNVREIHKALTSSGIGCTFVVAGVGPSEPELFIDRVPMEHGITSAEDVRSFFNQLEPDLLIQRDFGGVFHNFWTCAKSKDIPSYVYDQNPAQVPLLDLLVRPLRVIRFGRDSLRLRLKLGSYRRITPVEYWGSPGRWVPRNTTYIPFPMEAKAQPVFAAPREKLSVLTVAKHGQKRKRVHWLLRSLAGYNNPIQLDIVGSSPPSNSRGRHAWDRKLRLAASRINPTVISVVFHNDLNEEELSQLYSQADVFVLPAKREMIAISPLEAMAWGLPVLVSSDGGAVPYVSPTGKTEVFRSRSFFSFNKKLLVLLQDSRLRETVRLKGLEAVSSTHSYSSFVSKILELHELRPLSSS